jgi:pimeloyl-ACP methyl ester carboxylesterase
MVEPSIWQVSGLRLSGTDARPASAPRATIVALHGGGYSAGYWDHPLDPAASLLTLGPALGFRVVSIDRPGYGASHGLVGADVRMPRQADIVLDLVDVLRAGPDAGAATFLIGHSMGAILAVHMAASARAGSVAGVDISGLPFVFEVSQADQERMATVDFLPPANADFRRHLFYGPDGTFDPDILTAEEALARPVPAAEVLDAAECPDATPVLAPKVTVPIQITRAEFEASSGGGREGLNRLGSLFTSSPMVVLAWQRASGHNISLHHVARAYHLRALAFFDEVLGGAHQYPVTG